MVRASARMAAHRPPLVRSPKLFLLRFQFRFLILLSVRNCVKMASSDEAAATLTNKRPHSEVDATNNGEYNPPRAAELRKFARNRLTMYTFLYRRRFLLGR